MAFLILLLLTLLPAGEHLGPDILGVWIDLCFLSSETN